MADLDRRDFLKLAGLAGTGAALEGCSKSPRKLIPYITAPEDLVPGKATWYASTCRECPAGCGLLAKNRDGRVIKVEGNPLHPINGGKLCARGQASLQGLYNPDRFRGPMKRANSGGFEKTDWESAENALGRTLRELAAKGRGERIVFVTDLMTGTLKDLTALWLAEMDSPNGHVMFEPFAYEPLRKADQIVFGSDSIPSYRIGDADFLISFNAGFLETWLSNVEYARGFASFRSVAEGRKNPFVFVGPRLSLTAGNADLWIPVAPGGEFLVALGILRAVLDGGLLRGADADRQAAAASLTGQWPLETVAEKTGVEAELLRKTAALFAGAQRPLALAEGLSFTTPNAVETAVAANLLNMLHPGGQAALDFSSPSACGNAARAEALKELAERMKRGDVDLLLVHRANPVYALPASWDFGKGVEAVPLIVSFSSVIDETNTLAHWVLPTHTPLESWGDYSPRTGVTGLMQPVMGPLFDTKHLGDILISTGGKAGKAAKFPRKNFYREMRYAWGRMVKNLAPGVAFETFWEEALKRGGVWGEPPAQAPALPLAALEFTFPSPEAVAVAEVQRDLSFTAFPTVGLFDGREANKPWMQEIPDSMTQVTWGAWVELHPKTAERLGIERGDVLVLKSPYGSVEAPALPIYTVPPDTLAVPLGRGHTAYGRYAGAASANPMHLLPGDTDPASGGVLRPRFAITVRKTGRNDPIAHIDGSFFQYGRGIIQTTTLERFREAVAAKEAPELYLPMPEGYDPKRDFYPPHTHADYRWCMVVDLDRCIGCAACVAACYAENNLGVVGKEQVLKGREMAWIRLERFFDEDESAARWLPMLCQHCDNAPCEPVCPVYAPHHGKEGMNNQVYNRCIGTRFCLQNDPYKVRRFNWFTFKHPEPLNRQLNPDVTVREKGVMEKCSFCVQRVVEAKIKAKGEGRKLHDGEFTTACAQTCPTGALTFGSLMDPASRVSALVRDPRAYQVLMELNTKPAVIYLKRVTQALGVSL